MPYPSPADERHDGCVVVVAVIIWLVACGVILALRAFVQGWPTEAGGEELAIVGDAPAEGPTVTVREQSRGPLYDLPEGVEGSIVCDRNNRAYILLTTEEGGVAITPYLDEDGGQMVIPQS